MNELPIYKISGSFYFRDERLGEYRLKLEMGKVPNKKTPLTIPIDDVSLEDLQKPTLADKKKAWGD